MDQATAERWVTISAFTVAGVYGYRKLIEPSAPPATVKKLMGVGELPPVGSFVTAWGFTFLIIAIMTEASPGFGASFAILVATADLLTNSASIFSDVGKQEGSAAKPATASQVNVATGATTAAQSAAGVDGAALSQQEGFATAPLSQRLAGVNPSAPITVPVIP